MRILLSRKIDNKSFEYALHFCTNVLSMSIENFKLRVEFQTFSVLLNNAFEKRMSYSTFDLWNGWIINQKHILMNRIDHLVSKSFPIPIYLKTHFFQKYPSDSQFKLNILWISYMEFNVFITFHICRPWKIESLSSKILTFSSHSLYILHIREVPNISTFSHW